MGSSLTGAPGWMRREYAGETGSYTGDVGGEYAGDVGEYIGDPGGNMKGKVRKVGNILISVSILYSTSRRSFPVIES
jgi:hypothetical protein